MSTDFNLELALQKSSRDNDSFESISSIVLFLILVSVRVGLDLGESVVSFKLVT